MIQEMRNQQNRSQEQLAKKCGITRTYVSKYVSKIESNASEIKLSTLMRIISQGFGSQLKLTFG